MEHPKGKEIVIKLWNEETQEVVTIYERPEWTHQTNYDDLTEYLMNIIWSDNKPIRLMDWRDSIDIYETTAEFYYTDLEKVQAYLTSRVYMGDSSVFDQILFNDESIFNPNNATRDNPDPSESLI